MSDSMKKLLLEDAEYKKFCQIIATAQQDFNEQEYINELMTAHKNRLSPNLSGSKDQYSAEILMDASLHDLSIRSRMVELRVRLALRADTIDAALKAFSKYMYTKYLLDNPCYTTETQRNNYISSALKSRFNKLSRYKSLIEMADTFIKDIDQAGYNLRNMMDCLKLLSETKGKII